MAIDVKTAIHAATNYLTEVFSDVKDVQLEEVALSDDESSWEVTLSFLRQRPLEAEPALAGLSSSIVREVLGGAEYERLYKLVTVDAKSGKCQAIRIRQLQ